MKLKRILLWSSAALFLLFATLWSVKNGSGVMGGGVVSQKKMEAVKQKLTETEADTPLSFSLFSEDQRIPFDEGSRTFYYPVEKGGSLPGASDFYAEDTLLLFAHDPAGGGAAACEEMMRQNGSVDFIAVRDKQYTLCHLKPVGLPVMDFSPTDQTDDKGQPLFLMRLYEAAEEGVKVTECLSSASLRGNTSLTYEKKSLRLRLKKEKEGEIVKKKVRLLGMRKDDDWILNSLYADPSRIRDKLCMDLWKETGAGDNPYGITMGVEGEYVEVIIGGGYTGLYLLSYPVDRKLLSMDSVSDQMKEGKSPIERIYKKKYTAPLEKAAFEGALPDPGSPDLRGGYYLKGDTILQNEEEWEGLRQLAECYEADEKEFSERIFKICDKRSLLENWLFYQAIAGFDNENKNHYYVTRKKGDALVGYFIPWDMNISFGCVYEENAYYCAQSDESVEEPVRFEPGQRAFEENADGFAKEASDLWTQWRRGVFSDASLTERMDALSEKLKESGALAREQERWPEGNADGDLSFMKDFTNRRLSYLDGLLR
ncbi:MAG: CotH kinase family protein [Lachnospiraceae bacterium]|nr:CotH kinase family protein [Lachnospiraceae bacterium]